MSLPAWMGNSSAERRREGRTDKGTRRRRRAPELSSLTLDLVETLESKLVVPCGLTGIKFSLDCVREASRVL